MSDIIYDLERQIEINERSGFTGGLLDNALAHIKSQNTELERLRADVSRMSEVINEMRVNGAELKARAEKAEAALGIIARNFKPGSIWHNADNYRAIALEALTQKEPKQDNPPPPPFGDTSGCWKPVPGGWEWFKYEDESKEPKK